MAAKWIDLLDPSEEELREQAPRELEEIAIEPLVAHPRHDDEPRPTLQGHGDYVFGIFLLARAMPDEDSIYYQEIGVVLTNDMLLTIRKTPADRGEPYDIEPVRAAARDTDSPGMIAYRIVDDIAEKYLDLVDDVVEVERGKDVFPHDVEIAFNGAYDKLLRALDGLEFSRDLLSSVRDYHQSKIANDQNEVTKRLTVIASIILFPTFIVGVYGQNFVHMPELHWHYGYAYSWALIVGSTLVQLWWFRRKRWL
jgi:Mg2+ and Co2+ transporter CorA